MATQTYDPIASIILSASATSAVFANIPQTYTDLVLVFTGAGSLNGQNSMLKFNTDTSGASTNYSLTTLYGNGSTATSGRSSNVEYAGGCLLTNTAGIIIYHIMNYANTTTNKTVIGRGNEAGTATDLRVSLWRNTAAINTITFTQAGSGGGLASGAQLNLFGIKAGNA